MKKTIIFLFTLLHATFLTFTMLTLLKDYFLHRALENSTPFAIGFLVIFFVLLYRHRTDFGEYRLSLPTPLFLLFLLSLFGVVTPGPDESGLFKILMQVGTWLTLGATLFFMYFHVTENQKTIIDIPEVQESLPPDEEEIAPPKTTCITGQSPENFPLFFEESLVGDTVRQNWEDLLLLKKESDDLIAYQAEGPIKELVLLFEKIFFSVLKDSRRFNTISRNILSKNLPLVYRIARNLEIELSKYNPDQEIIQKIGLLLTKVKKLIESSSDNLYNPESSELEVDMRILEEDIARVDQKS